MNLVWKLVLGIGALALLSSCYEKKVVKLDYSERLKAGYYTPTGLPGDGHVGRTEIEDKYLGYDKDQENPGEVKKPEVVKPEEKKPEEVKPEVKKPEVVKPEEKKPEEVKPEVKKPEVVKPE
ncbi:MAG: hypothetical protein JRF33_24195, partial [Deltaproteobacteria bacterium]|nr:hypothetical protein [Deltaproteobacteria bacterium]